MFYRKNQIRFLVEKLIYRDIFQDLNIDTDSDISIGTGHFVRNHPMRINFNAIDRCSDWSSNFTADMNAVPSVDVLVHDEPRRHLNVRLLKITKK